MWVLIIFAVNISNPADVPARIVLDMPSIHMCEQTLDSMRYTLKYSSYRIEGRCQLKQY